MRLGERGKCVWSFAEECREGGKSNVAACPGDDAHVRRAPASSKDPSGLSPRFFVVRATKVEVMKDSFREMEARREYLRSKLEGAWGRSTISIHAELT